MVDNPDIGTCLIEMNQVQFSYQDHRVLKGINLQVMPGERLVLLGANGSGKSSLMRLIVGSSEPDSGELWLDGRPYSYNRKGRNVIRSAVQMVTQDPDEQIFATSVSADVSFGPVNMGLSESDVAARVDYALAAAEITALADRVPHQLSYGQRKRVALAGALAMKPRVLLLDEPSAGLDPRATEQLLGTLNQFHDMGTALVVATHDIDFAWAYAHRAAVLIDGELVIGEKEELLTNREVLESARLSLPWAPMVSRAVGKKISSPSELVD